MKTYKIWLFGDSAISLSEPQYFEFDDSRIEVRNHYSTSETIRHPFQDGLEYRILLQADNIKDAMLYSKTASVIVCDWLSFVHSAAVAHPIPLFAFDYEETATDREFAQLFRNIVLSSKPRRIYKRELMRLFHNKWCSLKDSATRDRLRRSMTLLRLSYTEIDVIDQFEDIWDGLETINPLLREKYSLPKTFPGSKCSNCGNQIQVPGSSSGIRHAVIELTGRPSTDWRELNDIRKDIVHGVIGFTEILPRLETLLPIARDALLNAILDLMEVAKNERSQFIRTPFQVASGIDILVSATLNNLSVAELERMTTFPSFNLTIEEVLKEGEVGVPGVKSISFTPTIELQNFSGTFKDVAIEVAVPKDPEDETATLTRVDQRIIRKDA